MYVDPEVALEGGVQALTLLNKVVTLAKTARANGKKGGLGIADIIERLPAEAFNLAGQFEKQVKELQQDFLKQGISLGRTLDDLQSETWFYQRSRRTLLDSFKPKTDAILAQLMTLMDDSVAVARCSGEEELLAMSYKMARERKVQLRQSLNPNLPVGALLKTLIDQAERMRAELGDML